VIASADSTNATAIGRRIPRLPTSRAVRRRHGWRGAAGCGVGFDAAGSRSKVKVKGGFARLLRRLMASNFFPERKK